MNEADFSVAVLRREGYVVAALPPGLQGEADSDLICEAMLEAAHDVVREANPERCYECDPEWGAEGCRIRDHWIDPDREYDVWKDLLV